MCVTYKGEQQGKERERERIPPPPSSETWTDVLCRILMDSTVRYGDFPSKSPDIKDTHTHTHSLMRQVREGKYPEADEADTALHKLCIHVYTKHQRQSDDGHFYQSIPYHLLLITFTTVH